MEGGGEWGLALQVGRSGPRFLLYMWVVVSIRVPFWAPIMHLISRVPQNGP